MYLFPSHSYIITQITNYIKTLFSLGGKKHFFQDSLGEVWGIIVCKKGMTCMNLR